jgi:cell division protein FtsQ
MSNLAPGSMTSLPLVTGEGAQTEVKELVNQLEASPDLLLKLKAAARVGQRRWNLYLDNGITVLLPENDVVGALAQLQALEGRQHLLSKGVTSVDLRFSGRVIVAIAQINDAAADMSTATLGKAN